MNTKQIQKNEKIVRLIEFNHELFSVLLITYLILLLVETVWKESVYPYVNVNYILIFVIVFGMISIFMRKNEEIVEKTESIKKDYVYIIILGITCSIIVWYKIKDVGNFAYLISMISGVIIVLLSLLILEDDKQ